MKKIMLISWMVVLFCVCFAVYAEEKKSEASAPNLSVSPQSWDFGTVIEGDIAERIFTIKNTGNAELAITNVRSSCGCAAALLSTDKVLPGQATELKVSFNSSGYRSNFEKYVYLTTNDPDEPYKTITINGSVKALPKIGIYIEPGTQDFVSAPTEQPSSFQFAIENRGNDALRISSIDTSSNLITTSINSTEIGPHKTTKVIVNLKPQTQAKKEEGHISLKIDIPVQYLR